MTIEDISREDRATRLESTDNNTFKKAYEEFCEAVNYAKEHFYGTSIYGCLKKAIERYTPRYNLVTR